VRFGSPVVDLGRRYISPRPIRSLRFGLVLILDVPQYISLDAQHSGIAPSDISEQHMVAPPPEAVFPAAAPSGFVATSWGNHTAELSIREVLPQGIPHRGNPQEGLTNPWGTHLVGFPRVFNWGGYDLTLWGDAWVSHKNRSLPVEGWSSLSIEDETLGSFSDRMRVRRRNPSEGLSGIGSKSVFGSPGISFSVRTILSQGISGYNTGTHVVSATKTLSPLSWDSLEIGNIDRWEAGKVKPHGDDLSTMGTPRTLRPLRGFGISAGVVGEPRFGVPLYPAGIPELGIYGPSISNPFGCTNRVVVPLPILPQQTVPQPAIA